MPTRRRFARRHGAAAFTPEQLEPRVLLAADPVTLDHPLWIVPRGSAVIDGNLGDPAWVNAGSVFRTQPTRDDRAVTVRMMYADEGIYLGVQVQDENIWADGSGGGAGNRWEVEQDDSVTFYFDADGSRDQFFTAADRALAFNVAAPTEPFNRTDGGPVRRVKFVRGDGLGGAPDVNPGGALAPGIAYATVISGTVNHSSDRDTGWTTEVFLPWTALNMSGPPVNGQTIGMNFSMMQDNAGGTRDLVDRRANPERFDVPHFIDDEVWGAHSSYTPTEAGTRGPINYAEALFVDPRAGNLPATIAVSSVTSVTPFGAKLNFTAPAGTVGGLGHVTGYQIRYSTAPITTEGRWIDATPFENAFVPRLRGLAESLRLSELAPATTYHVAIRAVDGSGNLGALSADASFTTAALPAPGHRGNIIPSPMGRTLQFEDGTPFVPVGDHLGISWRYTRTMYPGLIWDNANSQFIDFSDDEHRAVENIDTYLASLQARGINTMRTYLELQNVHVQGNPGPLPNGTYWLEDEPAHFNPAMQAYLNELLQRAAAHGIYVIVSPFDTFSYDESFGVEGPWAQSQGGPLTDIDFFFQNQLGAVNTTVLDLARLRMLMVTNWVNQSPFRAQVLGYEFLSEWDSYEWTLHPEGGGENGRATEFRTRAIFMDQLAAYVKTLSPDHLVLNSTISRDPRGPAARLNFYSRNFDALTPHLYTTGSEEPINNPQADTKILPAREIGYFTSYWVTSREDHAPILNGEWGLTRALWPGGVPRYSAAFTQAEDEAIYRTVTWAGFASGQAGSGLRVATEELASSGYILTDNMRAVQQTLSRFVTGTSLAIDFTDFNFQNLAGRLRAASAAGKSLLSWGISDGAQGIAYVLQNTNVTTGLVTDGRLVIDGLRADQVIDAEIWATTPGSAAPIATRAGLFVGNGQLFIDLPAFAEDVVVKFRARPATVQTQRLVSITAGTNLITFALGADNQPAARIMNSLTGQVAAQEIASIAGFRYQAVDMTAYLTPDGLVNLAVTDTRHHLWLFVGDPALGTWAAQDLTAISGHAGMSGDLTSYQPSWGAVHIAGLDARGHAINYWWAPAEPYWHFTDLTGSFDGVPLAGGLTGYVSGWDGLNLAGLDADQNLIVYWWAPGIERINGGDPGRWLIQNMTRDFGGPRFAGQLDAYVTPWGGLNVAGITAQGEVWTYWWAPGLTPEPNRWRLANLSAESGDRTFLRPGAEAIASPFDGSINIFGVDNAGHLRSKRWTPGSPAWTSTDITAQGGGFPVSSRLASTSAANRLLVAAAGPAGDHSVVLFSFFFETQTWQAIDTGMLVGL